MENKISKFSRSLTTTYPHYPRLDNLQNWLIFSLIMLIWIYLERVSLKIKGCKLKNLTKCSAWKNFTKSVENGNKNADIFFLCPRGKKLVVNHFSKLNSFRDMNFQKWSITDESFINVYETDNLHDSSVTDDFWKFISHIKGGH